jgi:hypothetical protein
MGRPPIGERAMTDAERKRRQRGTEHITWATLVRALTACKKRITELERQLERAKRRARKKKK